MKGIEPKIAYSPPDSDKDSAVAGQQRTSYYRCGPRVLCRLCRAARAMSISTWMPNCYSRMTVSPLLRERGRGCRARRPMPRRRIRRVRTRSRLSLDKASPAGPIRPIGQIWRTAHGACLPLFRPIFAGPSSRRPTAPPPQCNRPVRKHTACRRRSRWSTKCAIKRPMAAGPIAAASPKLAAQRAARRRRRQMLHSRNPLFLCRNRRTTMPLPNRRRSAGTMPLPNRRRVSRTMPPPNRRSQPYYARRTTAAESTILCLGPTAAGLMPLQPAAPMAYAPPTSNAGTSGFGDTSSPLPGGACCRPSHRRSGQRQRAVRRSRRRRCSPRPRAIRSAICRWRSIPRKHRPAG